MVVHLAESTIIDDQYEVLALLGEGGMGAVYLARELELDRNVAIKVLHASTLTDVEARTRFRSEAKPRT